MKIWGEQVNGKDFNGGRQWLVFEQVSDPKLKNVWYRHGRIHTVEEEAIVDFKQKVERYEKHGRKFKLMTRGVSPWRLHEEMPNEG